MIRKIILLVIYALAGLLLVLPFACGGESAPQTSAPEAMSPPPGAETDVADTSSATSISEGETAAAQPTSVPDNDAESTPTPLDIGEAVAERTPLPTPVPDVIDELITEFTAWTGLAGKSFLGLTTDDWINLGISVLIVLGGYFLGGRALKWLLRRLVRRTATEFDDQFLEAIQREMKWLVLFVFLWFATFRLGFLSDGLRRLLNDVYFVVGLVICTQIALKIIDVAVDWYSQRLAHEEDTDVVDPIMMLLQRAGRVVVIMIAAAVFFSHYGINLTAVLGAAGIVGLALSLAAQDTLSDVIAGYTILIDRPFRVGDRIEITDLGTWGDVVEIGQRTTRIRTRDNRLVIVPNSTIATSQVVNYTFPDPTYRIQMDIGIGYGQDIEKVRKTIVDTVRAVKGVLPDKPVDALYNEMGQSAMMFRVRWWIQSYEDTRQFYDRVNTALQNALDKAGIESPFTTYDIHLKTGAETAGGTSQPIEEAN